MMTTLARRGLRDDPHRLRSSTCLRILYCSFRTLYYSFRSLIRPNLVAGKMFHWTANEEFNQPRRVESILLSADQAAFSLLLDCRSGPLRQNLGVESLKVKVEPLLTILIQTRTYDQCAGPMEIAASYYSLLNSIWCKSTCSMNDDHFGAPRAPRRPAQVAFPFHARPFVGVFNSQFSTDLVNVLAINAHEMAQRTT